MAAPEGGPRAVAVLPGGRWIGFVVDGEECGLASARLGDGEEVVDHASASRDDLLALAEVWFAAALPEPPLDGAATQEDMAQLIGVLRATSVDPTESARLALVADAIDDALAPDAVANLLADARIPGADDSVVRLLSRAQALGWMNG